MPSDPHFRNARRQPVSLRVRFRRDQPGAALEHAGSLSDVGMGGAFVATDARHPVGTELVLVLSAPTAWDPIEIRVTVRWIAPPGSETQGFGVRFETLSPKEATALYDLVNASGFSDSELE